MIEQITDGVSLRALLIQKSIKRINENVYYGRSLRALLIQKSIKLTRSRRLSGYLFESFVNSEEYQTVIFLKEGGAAV